MATICSPGPLMLSGGSCGALCVSGETVSKVEVKGLCGARVDTGRIGVSKVSRSGRLTGVSSFQAFYREEQLSQFRGGKYERLGEELRFTKGSACATMAPPQRAPDGMKGGDTWMEAYIKQGNVPFGPGQVREGASDRNVEFETFSWKDHWYPVSLIEDLDTTVPTPFQLLGKEIVLWSDRDGNWKAFEDKCPHRLAPLSEGRLDDNGWLQCSYHGWSFKGDGSCGTIPQAMRQGPEARAMFSPRACAVTFPTLVSDGLLFVWPFAETTWKSASVQPSRLPAEFRDPSFAVVTIQRDLYYGYDTLMENVSDPSHIDFAHHKVTGRRDRAKPLTFKVTESGPSGFAGTNGDVPKITSHFLPPVYFVNKIEIPAKLPLLGDGLWVIYICSFNIPMAPGKTRSIVCSARNFFQFAVPGPEWWKIVPRWYEHWTSNKVYDGDMIVLQGQEKMLISAGTDFNKQYTNLTFTPTQADRFVLAFRRWLRQHGKGGPEWFPGTVSDHPLPSTVLSKRDMLDRYQQHTLKCSSCRNALNNFRNLQKIALGATLVLGVGVGIPSDLNLRIFLAVAAVLSGLATYILKTSEKEFIFRDYVHSLIN